MDTKILYKYFKAETTEQEEDTIVRWVESSSENRELYMRERFLYDASIFATDNSAHSNKRKNIFKSITYQLMAVAAVLSFGLFIGISSLSPEEILSQTIRIPAGQRAQMELPDGSVVWLNSQTTLTYDANFGEKDRNVTLDGEAYFEVAHNKEIPFYVQTEKIKIEVTGTKFDVCSYHGSNTFVARLIEGSIDLFAVAAEDKPIHSLTKGKYFLMKNGRYKTGDFDNDNVLAWTEGIYYFDDVPFNELLKKLALYYNYKITVENHNVLNGYRCTGKFKDLDGIEHILKVIQKDHSFDYIIDNDKNHITIK